MDIIKEVKWKTYEFIKCGLPWIFVGALLLYYHDNSVMQYDYIALIIIIAMTFAAVLLWTFIRLGDVPIYSSYNFMKHKTTKEIIRIYNIQKNQHGYVEFLIYKNNQWKWVSGKYYKPILDKYYD